MTPPERSVDRDAAIVRALELVPEHGWQIAALRAASPELADLDLLFPGGETDLIEAAVDLADRKMEEDAAAADLAGLGLSRRVRAIILRRLERQRPHREAIRRALALLALPNKARIAARITARTVDSIWHAAGDDSSDFSWYTKRAILMAVYSATLLYWLRDYSGDDSATAEFLDRRLAGLGRFFKLRAKIADRLHHKDAA
jgi:ubiquinone biosynthesis protein COQ9